MPSNFLRQVAEERDISIRAIEAIYEKAYAYAEKKMDEEDPRFYKYANSLFKNMLSISSKTDT